MPVSRTALALVSIPAHDAWWRQGFLGPSSQPHQSAMFLEYVLPKREVWINKSFRASNAYSKMDR